MLGLVEILKKEERPEELKKILEDASSKYVSLKYAFTKDLNYAGVASSILKRERFAFLTFGSTSYTEREVERMMLVQDVFPVVHEVLKYAVLLSSHFLDVAYHNIRERGSLFSFLYSYCEKHAPLYPVALGVGVGLPFLPVLEQMDVPPVISVGILTLGCLFFAFRNLATKEKHYKRVVQYYKDSMFLQERINLVFPVACDEGKISRTLKYP